MKIYELKERNRQCLTALLSIWEESVRATHLFLSDEERERIKACVPQALCGVEHLIVAEKPDGEPIAFMGTENGRLEMLFLSPAERASADSFFTMASSITELARSRSTNRIRRQSASINIWALKNISERNAMRKAGHIRFCI